MAETLDEIKGEMRYDWDRQEYGRFQDSPEGYIERIVVAHERAQWHLVSEPPKISKEYQTDLGSCHYNSTADYWSAGYYAIRQNPTLWRELPQPPADIRG